MHKRDPLKPMVSGITPRRRASPSLRRAATEMAELLESQSTYLRGIGQRVAAAQACREVRQLRLLAAIGG